ncbi:MAG: UDP-N-acetylglucosamine--N-acetylmuramyl-(pentapeptide) pyrophosphoryl-undecaprenol N-acetylglucosamine transferase [Verrucomicrobia bacterium]|nr:UDP-N-acetylglucosamine--N-acetylmuramyl-(pentapeptide) pyrophosphoryl-undecaprenol N-acetylglucosamine transferase [Verrucomicrobiota bacterium]
MRATEQKLNVHLACGGTGGHIFPGLATGVVLRDRGHRVTLWLAGKDVETSAISGWDGPVRTVPAEGFSSGLPGWRHVRASVSLLRASHACRRAMAGERPDALLAMGSYASVGPARAAFSLDVPVVLHESNVIPGRAVVMLSRHAAAVAAVFEETRYYLPRSEISITGMPMRREMIERHAQPSDKPPGGLFTVLVTGGSRGAKRLNELVIESVRMLGRERRAMRFLHLTGKADESRVRAAYEAVGLDHEVHAFTHDIASLYRQADLAICRSGAATCAELMLFALPGLLVPYPYAARNHQFANATAMAKHGAADMVEEKDLDCGWLAEYLAGMMKARVRLARMRAAMSRGGRTDAAEALADLVERMAHERRRERA